MPYFCRQCGARYVFRIPEICNAVISSSSSGHVGRCPSRAFDERPDSDSDLDDSPLSPPGRPSALLGGPPLPHSPPPLPAPLPSRGAPVFGRGIVDPDWGEFPPAEDVLLEGKLRSVPAAVPVRPPASRMICVGVNPDGSACEKHKIGQFDRCFEHLSPEERSLLGIPLEEDTVQLTLPICIRTLKKFRGDEAFSSWLRAADVGKTMRLKWAKLKRRWKQIGARRFSFRTLYAPSAEEIAHLICATPDARRHGYWITGNQEDEKFFWTICELCQDDPDDSATSPPLPSGYPSSPSFDEEPQPTRTIRFSSDFHSCLYQMEMPSDWPDLESEPYVISIRGIPYHGFPSVEEFVASAIEKQKLKRDLMGYRAEIIGFIMSDISLKESGQVPQSLSRYGWPFSHEETHSWFDRIFDAIAQYHFIHTIHSTLRVQATRDRAQGGFARRAGDSEKIYIARLLSSENKALLVWLHLMSPNSRRLYDFSANYDLEKPTIIRLLEAGLATCGQPQKHEYIQAIACFERLQSHARTFAQQPGNVLQRAAGLLAIGHGAEMQADSRFERHGEALAKIIVILMARAEEHLQEGPDFLSSMQRNTFCWLDLTTLVFVRILTKAGDQCNNFAGGELARLFTWIAQWLKTKMPRK